MSTPVFFAVDLASVDLTPDDAVLADSIVTAGRDVIPVVWGGRLPRHATLVVRSTWDYVEDPTRFIAWLAQLDADDVDVYNPTSLLRWNLHKRYLLELGGRGVPIVPTVVVAQHRSVDLGRLMHVQRWADAVVKPAVGGTARLACHVGDRGVKVAQRHLDEMLADEDALVQQFVPSVTSAGETSVVVIDGAITHAVRKTPAEGEWRVHVEFGGRVHLTSVDDDLATAARRAIEAIPTTPLYTRIDLVESAHGALQLIELELVEPELFFRLAPEAATRIAHLLTGRQHS